MIGDRPRHARRCEAFSAAAVERYCSKDGGGHGRVRQRLEKTKRPASARPGRSRPRAHFASLRWPQNSNSAAVETVCGTCPAPGPLRILVACQWVIHDPGRALFEYWKQRRVLSPPGRSARTPSAAVRRGRQPESLRMVSRIEPAESREKPSKV